MCCNVFVIGSVSIYETVIVVWSLCCLILLFDLFVVYAIVTRAIAAVFVFVVVVVVVVVVCVVTCVFVVYTPVDITSIVVVGDAGMFD